MKTLIKTISRARRHRRIRAKIAGTAQCPRVSVYKSLKHLRIQLIDDVNGKTLASLSTLALKTKGGVKEAAELGKALAAKATEMRIKKVVFDRGGYPYHGQVKAVAEAARAGGLIL